MLLDFLGEARGAEAIRHGVTAALDAGARTGDLCREGHRRVSTREMSQEIQRGIAERL